MLARWRSETPHVGEYIPTEGNIIAHKGKKTIKLKVSNTGDRPIQVGSHTHFSEANKALEFDREKALGYHLNIPSGTSVRFEPGESKHVEVVEFGGSKTIFGFSGLVSGDLESKKQEAIKNIHENNFKNKILHLILEKPFPKRNNRWENQAIQSFSQENISKDLNSQNPE